MSMSKQLTQQNSGWRRAGGVLALGTLLLGFQAHAALFEDEEARLAIIELRGRVTANQTALTKLSQESATGTSLLELSNQNESLRRELAQMRGQNEELARALTALGQRLDKANADVNGRLTKLEPLTVMVDGLEVVATPSERTAYDAAIATLRSGDYAGAQSRLQGFLNAYPATGYRPSALFWLGNAEYANQAFKQAQTTFNQLIDAYPQHLRVPESKLALANCQLELKDTKTATATLQALIKNHAGTEAAQTAEQRLKVLR
jgi:tol-pal system protein YbgF